jgi:zinc transport system substrate-binding protein
VQAILVAVALAGSACQANPATTRRTPTISVVTGLYPLAQAAAQIGGSAVAVHDVVPAGSDPRSYRLSPAQVAEVRQAAIVIVAAPGFQPALDAAATGAGPVLNLDAALNTADPYVWLDPQLMVRAVTALAASLGAANPAAANGYRRGAQAFSAQVASTGIDYESTLSTCPRRTIVTADGAFTGLARQYGLVDQVVEPADQTGPGLRAAAAAGRAAGATTAFREPFVPPGPIDAVAGAAHLTLRTLDPLTGPPPGGWPRGADYIRLMEANLGALNGALGCPDTGIGA